MAETYGVTMAVDNGMYIARRINDDLSWAVGSIGAEADRSDEAQAARARRGLDSIVSVPKGQENHIDCTDGRMPGVTDAAEGQEPQPTPVRPTLTGASVVAAHFALESVGMVPAGAPPAEAIQWTGELLRDVNISLDGHNACAAGDRYVAVKEAVVRFGALPEFYARNRETFLPTPKAPNGYSANLDRDIIDQHRRQLRNPENYSGLTLDTFLDTARTAGGPEAIASYVDDGRGVNGHVESSVFRLNTPGHAVDARAFNADGEQLFTTNDDMIGKLAARLAFGLQRPELEVPMRQAMNLHANAAHGVLLAPGAPTWLVQKIGAHIAA